jgi:hypothetical protein
MKMEQTNEKYKKVLEILKNSKPVLGSYADIEEKVLERISVKQKSKIELSDLVDFLFGWTYIAWVRRSLITASVCMVIVFVFQQSIMMKQINNLSRQIESYERDASGAPLEYPERRMMFLRFSEKRFPLFRNGRSDKQVEELLRTIDQLKKEYKELDSMLKDDPELKGMIEKKLSEINGNRTKI